MTRPRAETPVGSVPDGPPAITADGWEYDLGDGFGILPRFDGADAKGSRSHGGRGPDVDLVVRRAVERLRLPEPVIRTSPDEDSAQVVHVPTWMWVENSTWHPVSASVAADGVRVVATAQPRKANWSMGEGGEVECQGPGTAYSGEYAPEARSPDCGYTYRRASISELPDGTYTVSVRVTWDVEWRGGGRSGTVPGRVASAARQLVVDEVQAVVTR